VNVAQLQQDGIVLTQQVLRNGVVDVEPVVGCHRFLITTVYQHSAGLTRVPSNRHGTDDAPACPPLDSSDNFDSGISSHLSLSL